ncbi:hypothetical protein ACFWY9_16390 [Amycolatopsis sp. NPDC059027]|uniref:hypothetical protein n=1 Tax=unclassified Amycolatopsis TaxID=2618356 RepID=UPI00366B3DD9
MLDEGAAVLVTDGGGLVVEPEVGVTGFSVRSAGDGGTSGRSCSPDTGPAEAARQSAAADNTAPADRSKRAMSYPFHWDFLDAKRGHETFAVFRRCRNAATRH